MPPNDPIEFFAAFIERELGIVYSEHNRFQLQNRLEEIARYYGLADVAALYQKARDGITGSFRQYVLDTATNNETSFFRDPKLFEVIGGHVFPELMKGGAARPRVRIWSAACSTGQEPYSLAMLWRSVSAALATPAPPLEIVATDVSERVLVRARDGRYTQLEVQRGLATTQLLKNFAKNPDDIWTISPENRRMVDFRSLNLLSAWPEMGRFDLVFCRNMLIYQRIPARIQIIDKITRLLNPGGYLILGAGESLIGISERFEQVKIEPVVIYRARPAIAAAA